MQTYTNKALGLFVVAALALAAVPLGSAQATGGFGRVVTATTPDTTYVLAAGGPATPCFIDTDGSTAFSPDEPVYLQAGCGAIIAGSVRVANPSTGAKGSQVLGTDADIGRVTGALAHVFAFFDSNGDGRFSATGNDVLYLAVGATVAIGDIVLSGTNAGTVVSGSTAGLNNAVAAGAGTVSFFDSDNNGAFSLNDGLYYDGPGAGAADLFASVGDVQLSGAAPTGGGGTATNTGTSTVTGTGTSTSTATGTGTGTTTSTGTTTTGTNTGGNTGTNTGGNTGGQTTDDGNDTPGFELVALVAALAVALVLVRRKL